MEISRLGIVVAPGCKAVAVLSVWVTGMLVGTTVHLQEGSTVIHSHPHSYKSGDPCVANVIHQIAPNQALQGNLGLLSLGKLDNMTTFFTVQCPNLLPDCI